MIGKNETTTNDRYFRCSLGPPIAKTGFTATNRACLRRIKEGLWRYLWRAMGDLGQPVTDLPQGEDRHRAETPDEDTWIVAANSELKIRLRSLTQYLQRGGSLKDIRLLEGEDGTWTMWVRLRDRPGEFRVNKFQSHQPKTYKNVAFAVSSCRRDLGYAGPITLLTDKLPGRHAGPSADTDFDTAVD